MTRRKNLYLYLLGALTLILCLCVFIVMYFNKNKATQAVEFEKKNPDQLAHLEVQIPSQAPVLSAQLGEINRVNRAESEHEIDTALASKSESKKDHATDSKEDLSTESEIESKSDIKSAAKNKKAISNADGTERKSVVLEEVIPFKTEYRDDSSLSKGTTKVLQAGKNGMAEVTWERVYKNGRQVDAKPISRKIVREAEDRIILRGTKVQAAANTKPEKVDKPKQEIANNGGKGPDKSADKGESIEASQTETVQKPSFTNSVTNNLNLVKTLLGKTYGTRVNYDSFKTNSDQTITVNGKKIAYLSVSSHYCTSYDGLAAAIAAGAGPDYNRKTASGVVAQRGLCASNQFPFGTVLFVEGYGFCIVADRHGTGRYPDLVDVCYNAGEVHQMGFGGGRRHVYLIYQP